MRHTHHCHRVDVKCTVMNLRLRLFAIVDAIQALVALGGGQMCLAGEQDTNKPGFLEVRHLSNYMEVMHV